MGNREMAIEVRRELTARQDMDAEPNLIDQSEATIRQRELQMNQAHSDLVKAQIRFISLVNAPELLNNSNNIEILPQVVADLDYRDLDIDSRVNTAIQRRPEIGDVIEQIKSAQVANHLSLNELLPRLALSLEAGLNGLEGDSQLGDAISNQFDNDVTYQVGVDFEVPLANRRARFNQRRTELVVARLRSDWQDLIQQVKADVLDNAQEFQASQQRLDTQRQVLKFTANELRYLGLRKTVAPKETDNVSFALTQVLSAQDHQGEAKSDFIAAIADSKQWCGRVRTVTRTRKRGTMPTDFVPRLHIRVTVKQANVVGKPSATNQPTKATKISTCRKKVVFSFLLATTPPKC